MQPQGPNEARKGQMAKINVSKMHRIDVLRYFLGLDNFKFVNAQVW